MWLVAPWGSAQRAAVLPASLLETDFLGEGRRPEPSVLLVRGVRIAAGDLVRARNAAPPLAGDVGVERRGEEGVVEAARELPW
eukprot:4849402-Alexandrium_andersonii.AAC.1